MDEELEEKLSEYIKGLTGKNKALDETIKNPGEAYPFNKYEYIISQLLANNAMSIEEYKSIRNSYIERNKNLKLFELSPRTFGEKWAESHLNEIVPELKKPTKKLDPNYQGEYDLWYDGVKIEVKASRAVDANGAGPVVTKALSSDSKKKFNMNFQQIKTKCCDVFVWMGVWKNRIKYWVLASSEVRENKYYSIGQHRGNTDEGQLWITESNINDFDVYECAPESILEKIVDKSKI